MLVIMRITQPGCNTVSKLCSLAEMRLSKPQAPRLDKQGTDLDRFKVHSKSGDVIGPSGSYLSRHKAG